MTPLVSVIMPARNVERYVDEAVRSVLDQRAVSFELLIADDHSTDTTWDRIKTYRNDPGVRVWRFRKKKGPGAAYNYLITRARGRYIAHCDADDRLLPGFLIKVVNAFQRNPDVGAVSTRRISQYRDHAVRTAMRKIGSAKAWDLIGGAISNGGTAVRRDLLVKAGGYRTDLPYLEDCELFWRLGEMTRILPLKGKPLYFYRKRRGSLTDRFKKMGQKIRLKLLREVIQRRYGVRPRW